jgi:hypothetical protein
MDATQAHDVCARDDEIDRFAAAGAQKEMIL